MFLIKRALMKKILNKRKKKKPFDYEKAEAYSLELNGDGAMNNSYYFTAHSLEKGISLYARLGLRADGSAEAWLHYNLGNEHYHLQQLFFTQEDCPLKVYQTEGGWRFSFEGEMVRNQDASVPVSLDCTFSASGGAVDFFYHMPSVRMATCMAQDKWTKEYFAEVSKNDSVHYEQEGRIIGSISIDGRSEELDLPCLRDHSYGRRVWSYMNNHAWFAAVDKDCMFNFSLVSYPALSLLEVGHLRAQNERVEFITKAHHDRFFVVQATIPETLDLLLTTTDKRKVRVTAKLLQHEVYSYDDGNYLLFEGIAEYDVDGTPCRGILEVGFNSDTTRFMNGKPISTLKE